MATTKSFKQRSYAAARKLAKRLPTRKQRFDELFAFVNSGGVKRPNLVYKPGYIGLAPTTVPQDELKYQLRMTDEVLTEGAKKVKKSDSGMLSLPQELFLKVVEQLHPSDLISLSLTSKALAWKTESMTKIANIVNPKEICGSPDREFRMEVIAQNRAAVGGWLGNDKFRYCNECEMFRLTDEKFWYDMLDHMKPHLKVIALMAKDFPAGLKAQRTAMKARLAEWHQGGKWSPSYKCKRHICPAHLFAKERAVWTRP